MIYHQNIQLSMKQEAVAPLPPQLSGRLSYCKARWNNSCSVYCNTVEMRQPKEHAIDKDRYLLWKYSSAPYREKQQREIEFIHVCERD